MTSKRQERAGPRDQTVHAKRLGVMTACVTVGIVVLPAVLSGLRNDPWWAKALAFAIMASVIAPFTYLTATHIAHSILEKKFRWRVIPYAAILLVGPWCLCLLVSSVVYCTSAHGRSIQRGVGRQVEFTPADAPLGSAVVRGTLNHAEYQFEPGKTWVLYVDIGVSYERPANVSGAQPVTIGGGTRTILSPFQLDRVKFLGDPSNQRMQPTDKSG